MMQLSATIEKPWAVIEPILSIRSEVDYDRAIQRLNELLDEIGDNEAHPVYGFLDTLGTLLHAYEEVHYPMAEVSGVEMLHYLMQEHDLTQSDLPEIGSQGVVSEILNGKRELNVRHIRALAARFHVSPAVFM